jgi:hypothetical protein
MTTVMGGHGYTPCRDTCRRPRSSMTLPKHGRSGRQRGCRPGEWCVLLHNVHHDVQASDLVCNELTSISPQVSTVISVTSIFWLAVDHSKAGINLKFAFGVGC